MQTFAVPAPPVPAEAGDWALFLDFDGTLTEIADAPHLVDVDARLPGLLSSLQEKLGGALALVSGRPLAELDDLTGIAFSGAGVHGLELRRPGETEAERALSLETDRVKPALQALVQGQKGLFLEEKSAALALHYRAVPEAGSELFAAVNEVIADFPELGLIRGKMVIEVKPKAANKGTAIRSFMAEKPFAGRIPVFAGDDVTDEDGFRAVNDLAGVSVKVGEGESVATHRLGGVGAVLDWLGAIDDAL